MLCFTLSHSKHCLSESNKKYTYKLLHEKLIKFKIKTKWPPAKPVRLYKLKVPCPLKSNNFARGYECGIRKMVV